MKKACILFADGLEEVEAITPLDYLRRAGIETLALGLKPGTVKGAHMIEISTDAELRNHINDKFDCIIIPGGFGGSTAIAQSADACTLIKRIYAEGGLVCGICAAPALVLGESCGLLSGKEFTCYPGMESHVKNGRHVNKRVVKDGNLITSQGPACAGEFALAIIEALMGAETAKKIAAEIIQ